MLAAAIAAGWAAGLVALPSAMAPAWNGFAWALPSLGEIRRGIELLVLPQLPLTLSNAVIVAALVCRDLFPAAAGRASERNLALSTGLANLALVSPWAPCPCATAPAACRPTTASAHAPALPPCCSAACCWC